MRHVGLISVLSLLLFISTRCVQNPFEKPGISTREPSALQTISFVPLADDVLNPERGFRYYVERLSPETNFSTFRALGTTLVFAYARLDDYRERALPPDFLDGLDQAFAHAREGGVKLVLRFAYNAGPYPHSKPDANLPRILQHIHQLTPVLQRNADVIAWLQAGFIGAWGEWHTSTHGLDKDPEAKKAVVWALLDALPRTRMVQIRYPTDLRRWFPVPLQPEQAYTGLPQARLGFHNDCFLSSEDDVGTYNRDGRNTRKEDEAYLAQSTQYTPAGGETCQVYPPLQTCDVAIAEMERLHFQALNRVYNKRVIRNWKREGCFYEIQRRLGYRFVLEDATFPTEIIPGSELEVTLHVRNEGFATPVNPRPLYLVLDGPETYRLSIPTTDPRQWAPGRRELTLAVQLPPFMPQGSYRLALWLPDAMESLQDDPRYSIRFANEGVWNEERGWNLLGEMAVR